MLVLLIISKEKLTWTCLLVVPGEELESISVQGGLGGEVSAGRHVTGQDVAEGVQLDVLQLQAGENVVGNTDSTCKWESANLMREIFRFSHTGACK